MTDSRHAVAGEIAAVTDERDPATGKRLHTLSADVIMTDTPIFRTRCYDFADWETFAQWLHSDEFRQIAAKVDSINIQNRG